VEVLASCKKSSLKKDRIRKFSFVSAFGAAAPDCVRHIKRIEIPIHQFTMQAAFVRVRVVRVRLHGQRVRHAAQSDEARAWLRSANNLVYGGLAVCKD